MRHNELLLREIDAHKRTDLALQAAKDLAEAANQAKTRYVTGMTHELRTPLNSILGYAQGSCSRTRTSRARTAPRSTPSTTAASTCTASSTACWTSLASRPASCGWTSRRCRCPPAV